MNENFKEWAKKVHSENPDVIKHWKQSNDIIERALANAIYEIVRDD
ncbi:hypothetical protein V7O66_06560 [Methanolobus sp. ZRKC3]